MPLYSPKLPPTSHDAHLLIRLIYWQPLNLQPVIELEKVAQEQMSKRGPGDGPGRIKVVLARVSDDCRLDGQPWPESAVLRPL